MKHKINIKNYESFYLDYLEGSLDNNLTLALLDFLAENPEMRVEGLGPEISASAIVLDDDFKNKLKQVEHTDAISSSNIEYFLTAEKENQLTAKKLNELNEFISSHPEYNLVRKIYSLAFVLADPTEVYADKKSLKRRETIVLWPYLSLLAAACAILIVWIVPNSAYDSDMRSSVNIRPHSQKPKAGSNNVKNNLHIQINTKSQTISHEIADGGKQNFINTNKKEITGKLNTKKTQQFEVTFTDNITFTSLPKETPRTIAYQRPEASEDVSTALAMNNPVKPLTTKLSNVIKTQVDYQTGKNTVSQRKRFYLKIGQFEMYQNKKARNKN